MIHPASLVLAAAWPPFCGWLLARWLPLDRWLLWCGTGIGLVIDALLHRDWLTAGTAAANAALGIWLWWRNRRRRDRAGKALGAKSRALLAALVARAREAAQPRRVLKPAPGGAR